ncbi:MAG: thioredoxin domain-containing protein [Holosporales bacterium]|jgi:protein-disulfide isomerase|nr:thioredoxin domain-containing protein [Holosporales bacterium]
MENRCTNGKLALGVSIVAFGISVCSYFCPKETECSCLSQKGSEQGGHNDKLKENVIAVIKNNPQAIMDAMGEGMAKKREDTIKKLEKDVVSNKDELTKMGLKFGDTKSKITVLAFVDPVCEHCMNFEQDLVKIVKSKKSVNFVILPVAVIGADSVTLAKVYHAIDEVNPAKTIEFIEVIASSKEPINKNGIEKALKSIGLSYKDIESHLESGDKKIAENGKMAKKLEVPVVPAVFIIDGNNSVMMQEPSMDGILQAIDKGIDVVKTEQEATTTKEESKKENKEEVNKEDDSKEKDNKEENKDK